MTQESDSGETLVKHEFREVFIVFCSNCGSKLVEGARFCSNCGAPVVAQEEPRTVFEDTASEVNNEAPESKEVLEPADFNLDWETVDDEAPAKTAFDKRVSFDWTSVIDESHKKSVVDIKSPWDEDATFEDMSKTIAPPQKPEAPVAQPEVDEDLMKEFEGIDVTPTTEKGRTLTFIEILKKEREEKERASEAAAAKLTQEKPAEGGDSFEELSYIQAAAQEIKEASANETEAPAEEPAKAPDEMEFEPIEVEPIETAPMMEPVSAGTDITETIKPAAEPMTFVQPAVEEMADLKDAYNEAKAEVPEFELPVFGVSDTTDDDYSDDVEDEDDVTYTDEDEKLSFESVEDMYLADDFGKSSDEDDDTLTDEPEDDTEDDDEFEVEYIYEDEDDAEETPAAESVSVKAEPEVQAEPAQETETTTEEEPAVAEPEDNRTPEEKLEAELAAILATGNGYIPDAAPVSTASDVDLDLYDNMGNISSETVSEDAGTDAPKHGAVEPEETQAEPVSEDAFEGYADGFETEEPATENHDCVDAVEAEMEVTPEEAAAEEYFADMIDAVTDRTQDPLADVEHLTIEDIFDDEYMSGLQDEEVTEETPVAKVKEEALEEEASELDEKDSEILALKRRLAELIAEKEEETVVPANPAVATIEDIFPEEEIVPEFNLVEEVDEETEVHVEDDDAAAESATPVAPAPELPETPVAEAEAVTEEPLAVEAEPVREEPTFEPFEFTAKNEALDDIADLQTDAMSIEELEKELFGDESLDDDNEAEATRKIDKFYTLYKKNEEFQKLLDDEYNRIQVQDDEPTELSDATITQLDNLVLSADEIADKEPEEVKSEEVAEETDAKVEEPAAAPVEEKPAPIMEEEPLSPKEAKKAAKKAAKEAKKAAKNAPEEEDEEEEESGGTALTIIAVIIALILVFLLVAILILNFAPDSAMGLKLDALVQSISCVGTDIDANDGFLL